MTSRPSQPPRGPARQPNLDNQEDNPLYGQQSPRSRPLPDDQKLSRNTAKPSASPEPRSGFTTDLGQDPAGCPNHLTGRNA